MDTASRAFVYYLLSSRTPHRAVRAKALKNLGSMPCRARHVSAHATHLHAYMQALADLLQSQASEARAT
jgi:hypothetical protein